MAAATMHNPFLYAILLKLNKLINAGPALGHGFDEAAPDVEDDDARMVFVVEGVLEGLGEFILCRDGLGFDTEALGVLDIIHRVVELAGDVALLVHDFLELANHAEAPVVDNERDDGQFEPCNRVELVARHLDAAVAGHVNEAAVFAVVELCAHGCGQAEAHRAKAARSQPRARLLDGEVQRGPHLMLADVSRIGVFFTLRALADLMHGPRHGQAVLVVIVGIGFAPFVNLRPPVCQARVCLVLHQQRKNDFHIAGKAETVGDVLIDFCRVNVDVNELRVLRVLVEVAGLTVRKAAADSNDEVGRANCVVRGFFAVHAGKAQGLRMGARNGAKAHECMDDGQMVFLDKRDDFFRRAGRDDTAADNDDWFFRLDDFVGRFRCTNEKVGIGLAVFFFGQGLGLIVDIREKNIARHVDEHGARSAVTREGKGLAHGRHEFFRVLDFEIMLRHGHGHIEDVRFLKRVTAHHGSIDLPRDGHDRNRIHEGRRQARDEVRRARPRRRDADADFARNARVAIGGMRGILLVSHEDFPNIGVLIKRIVERQNHAARIAKDCIDALLF